MKNLPSPQNIDIQKLSIKESHADRIIYKLLTFLPEAEIFHDIVALKNGNITTEALKNGLEWAINLNVDIINMSLSFPKPDRL